MNDVEEIVRMRFDGKLHQVDSNTFIASLIGFSEVIKQVNSELNPGTKVDIKINALEKGSFIVEIATFLSPLLPQLPTIFSTTVDTFDVVKGLYGLRKFLKGARPDSVESIGNNIKISDNKGQVIITDSVTFNIYNSNPTIQKAITGQFLALQEDPSVDAFELLTKENEEIFSAQKTDFQDMSKVRENTNDDSKLESIIAELTISKLVFENNQTRKWEFFYRGNKISANIIDNSFFKRIDAGETFAKGDRLMAELAIQMTLDHSVNVYVIDSYTVTKILEHRKRPEELSMFESQDHSK